MTDTATATAPAAANTQAAPASATPLLDQIISDGNMVLQPAQQPGVALMLNQFATEALGEKLSWNDQGIMKSLAQRVEQIDAQLSAGLNAVLHSEKFRALEQSWRGLHDLVMNTETGPLLKLRLFNVTQKELAKDLKKAIDVDQSALFKKVYEEEYGTYGGSPYGLLIGDFAFGRSAEDIGLLTKIAQVAAMAHAPFIAAAGPALFDMRQFIELGIPRDLSKTFESSEMAGWRAFRDSEDSRYVALTLPRYLLRLPYGPTTSPVESFAFDEGAGGMPHDNYLWGNSAYLLGQRITDAFAKYHWSAAIRGVEGGGLVEDLPVCTFSTKEGDKVMKCPTEIAITDRREKELSDLGFIAIVHKKNENVAAFFGGQTVNKPLVYNKPQATANARLSSQLPCMMAASRFAHYIKVKMRDKIGSFTSRDEVSTYLNNWIADYVLVNDNSSQSLKAQYPLREARIDVTDDPAKPGVYKATVFLRPHFQLEELTASVRLVAELPPPVAA